MRNCIPATKTIVELLFVGWFIVTVLIVCVFWAELYCRVSVFIAFLVYLRLLAWWMTCWKFILEHPELIHCRWKIFHSREHFGLTQCDVFMGVRGGRCGWKWIGWLFSVDIQFNWYPHPSNANKAIEMSIDWWWYQFPFRSLSAPPPIIWFLSSFIFLGTCLFTYTHPHTHTHTSWHELTYTHTHVFTYQH